MQRILGPPYRLARVMSVPSVISADAKMRSHSIERNVCLQLVAAGGVVCHPEWPVPLVSRFTARILVLEPPIPVLQGQQVSKSK